MKFILVLLMANGAFGSVSWKAEIKKAGISEAVVCGNDQIQASEKSLRKDFAIGVPPRGFLVQGLMPSDQHWKILQTQNLETASKTFNDEMGKAQLWIFKNGSSENLGVPKEVRIKFSSTIKDCMEGAKGPHGLDCTPYKSDSKRLQACCTEKFSSPSLVWKTSMGNFKLDYAPGTGSTLTVPGEKKDRFCQVHQTMKF